MWPLLLEYGAESFGLWNSKEKTKAIALPYDKVFILWKETDLNLDVAKEAVQSQKLSIIAINLLNSEFLTVYSNY